jgi:hypothetical protein
MKCHSSARFRREESAVEDSSNPPPFRGESPIGVIYRTKEFRAPISGPCPIVALRGSR